MTVDESWWAQQNLTTTQQNGAAVKREDVDAGLPLPEGMADRSDSANAFRLLAWHGADMRYVEPLGGWFLYDGRRWRLDEAGAVLRAQATAQRMLLEAGERLADVIKRLSLAVALGDKERVEALRRERDAAEKSWSWAASSQNARGLRNMLEVARSSAWTEPGVFDRDPHLLNVQNGTIDLRDARLRPHQREDMIAKLAPVNYHGMLHESAKLTQYITSSSSHHEGLSDFLSRMLGSALIGLNPEEAFYVVHGPPASGKTTWLEASAAMLGDYACSVSVDTFLAPLGSAKGAGEARPDLAKLHGKRLVICSEVPKGRRFDEALVKKITSDTITARKLFRDEFEFAVSFKVWMACNEAPKITPDEEAIWRRLHLIPLDKPLAAAERDTKLKTFLRTDPDALSALLALAVRGCLAYQQDQLAAPPCVREATGAYRESQDALREFLEERCVLGNPEDFVIGGDIRRAYEEWCKESGHAHPLGPDMFGKLLRRKGCEVKSKRVDSAVRKAWYGVRLRVLSDHIHEPDLPVTRNECNAGLGVTFPAPARA